MKLSNQAMGALMMALQKSLLEQTDIVPTLESFIFEIDKNERLIVKNPPNFKIPNAEDLHSPRGSTFFDENTSTTGSD